MSLSLLLDHAMDAHRGLVVFVKLILTLHNLSRVLNQHALLREHHWVVLDAGILFHTMRAFKIVFIVSKDADIIDFISV